MSLTLDQVCELIKANDCKAIRILDMYNNKIDKFEGISPDACSDKLRERAQHLVGYKSVRVVGSTSINNAKEDAGYKWILVLQEENKAAPAGAALTMPAGWERAFALQGEMNKQQLDFLSKFHDLEKKLEKKDEGLTVDKLLGILPTAIALYKGTPIPDAPMGAAPTMKKELYYSDKIDKKDLQEKTIEQWNELEKKVGLAKMYDLFVMYNTNTESFNILLDKVKVKPKLIQAAINFINSME